MCNYCFVKCQKSFHPTQHVGDIISAQNNVQTSRKWNVLCRTSALSASLCFSDPFQADAKLSMRLESSPFLTQVHSQGQGHFQHRPSKSLKTFKRRAQCHHKVHIVLHSSSYWCYQSALSLSSLWPLGFRCIFWGLHFPARNGTFLFVLHRLIHFKLLPNSSPLPCLERGPFVPQRNPGHSQAVSVCQMTWALFLSVLFTCVMSQGRVAFPSPFWVHCDFGREESPLLIHLCSP